MSFPEVTYTYIPGAAAPGQRICSGFAAYSLTWLLDDEDNEDSSSD